MPPTQEKATSSNRRPLSGGLVHKWSAGLYFVEGDIPPLCIRWYILSRQTCSARDNTSVHLVRETYVGNTSRGTKVTKRQTRDYFHPEFERTAYSVNNTDPNIYVHGDLRSEGSRLSKNRFQVSIERRSISENARGQKSCSALSSCK